MAVSNGIRPKKGLFHRMHDRAGRGRTRDLLSGALLAVAALVLLVAAGAPNVPPGGFLGDLARLLEGGALHILGLNIFLALGLSWLGRPAEAIVLAVASLVSGTVLWGQVLLHVAPASIQPRDVTIVWWNMLWNNPTPSEGLYDFLLALDADVIVLAEAVPVQNHLDILENAYPYRMGCPAQTCNLLVFSRHPLGAGARIDAPGPLWQDRMATLHVTTQAGPVTLIAVHLSKPWYGFVRQSEDYTLYRLLKRLNGPVILVGDFNSPPWGWHQREMVRENALTAPGVPPATWPTVLGRLGLAIDQVFVRDAVFANVERLAESPGSNHSGLIIYLAVKP